MEIGIKDSIKARQGSGIQSSLVGNAHPFYTQSQIMLQ